MNESDLIIVVVQPVKVRLAINVTRQSIIQMFTTPNGSDEFAALDQRQHARGFPEYVATRRNTTDDCLCRSNVCTKSVRFFLYIIIS